MEELKMAEVKIADLEKKLSESVSTVEDLSKKLEESEAKCKETETKLFDVQSSLEGYTPDELKMILAKLKNQPAPDSTMDGKSKEELMAMISELQGKVDTQVSENAELKKANEAYKASEVLAQKNGEFNTLLSEGKAVEAQRQAFIAGDVVEFAKHVGKLNLSEKGSGYVPPTEDATKELTEEEVIAQARILVSEKKAKNIGEAISKVLSEQKSA